MIKIFTIRLFLVFALAAMISFNLGAQTVSRATKKPAPFTEAEYRDTLLAEAKSGDAKAQHILGYQYMTGLNFERNYDLGLKWLRTSASAGNTEARWLLIGFLLGSDDKNMFGNPAANRQEALKWRLLLARGGDAEAQDDLGMDYYLGTDVPKDLLVAEHWLGLSAEQGNISGQLNLGRLLIYAEDGDPLQRQRWAAGIKWLTVCHALAASEVVDALTDRDEKTRRIRTKTSGGILKLSAEYLKPEPWKYFLTQRQEGERQARAWLEIHQRR